jgi:hypothetical protein
MTDTFNTGQNKFAVQFTQSTKMWPIIYSKTADEGYLVTKMVKTGKE